MRGYFIDAHNRRVEDFEYSYADLSPKLGGSMSLAKVFKNHDVLYVSDDGLLKRAVCAFRLKSYPNDQPLMSDGILTGTDNIDPEAVIGTMPPRMSLADLQAEIEWLTVEQALGWFRAHRTEPAVIVTTGGIREVVATWADFLLNLEGKPGGYDPDSLTL